MSIAIDTRLTHYRKGGIATYMAALATGLPSLDPNTPYAILQMAKNRTPLTLPPNAKPINCLTPAHHRLERTALAFELAAHQFGRTRLLHSPDFIAPIRLGWQAIITIHDLTFLKYPQFLTAQSRRYYNGQIHASIKTAAHILCDSEATRQDLLTLLNVPPEKATTVHLGIDPQYQPQTPAAIHAVRQHFNLPATFLLFVGTFEPRKNVTGLLQAYAALRTTHSDAPPLVLAGQRGWLFSETEAEITRLGLKNHLVMLENIPNPHLPALYAAAHALILPSHYEGFGLPVLEAMACGTPTIIANRASLPEIAGDAALKIDPDHPDELTHALQQILTDTVLHAQLSAAGRIQTAQFTWQACCKKTLAVYNSVLN